MTDTSKDAVARLCLAMINSGNTTTANMLNALADERDRLATAHKQLMQSLAAANARADQAWDSALVEAAARFPDSRQPWPPHAIREAILTLRDKPVPGVTPKIEVKFTWAKGDEEFWVHLKSPDGKSAGFNLGNPKGMIATALLRAIAGGGDE